ncbi:MAG: 4-hydroxy-3-methylbut-2-enyl diphosphate reductase [Bacteroidales bacterium]|nr:4-hydroxy-3-methylbut-2-enyl diphosphate reductase [Bacteroidales bacterium]
MKVEIDKDSGFCFGVVNAIQMAEEELQKSGSLYCLGDIVHNNVEVNRLKNLGLKTIEHDEYKKLYNTKVLIRAHGEPPETYRIAKENNIELIDASCPVVLRLQERIKIGYNLIKKTGGQVVIYGKQGHAEVNGLVGQTNNEAIVIENPVDIEKINLKKPIVIFSQTTKSIEGYREIMKLILEKRIEMGINPPEIFENDTICRQVSTRGPRLMEFAKKHSIIIFVSGKKSSNGRMLYEVCKNENPKTYFVSEIDELQADWFKNIESVGVCGATSSPRWLMEQIAEKILEIGY